MKMFKIPDWEADIADNQIDFLNNISKNKVRYPKDTKILYNHNKFEQQVNVKLKNANKSKNKIKIPVMKKKLLRGSHSDNYDHDNEETTTSFFNKLDGRAKNKVKSKKKRKSIPENNEDKETFKLKSTETKSNINKKQPIEKNLSNCSGETVLQQNINVPKRKKIDKPQKAGSVVVTTPTDSNFTTPTNSEKKLAKKLKANSVKVNGDSSGRLNTKAEKPNSNEKLTVNSMQKKQKSTIVTTPDSEKKLAKKRKANGAKVNGESSGLNIKVEELDFDKADELIVSAKKKKLNQVYRQEDNEDELFPKENKSKMFLKKQKLKQMLEKNVVNRNSIKVNGTDLRTRMLERLKAAQFRYLNEKLYTSTGTEAQKLFQTDPSAFQTYHQGYQLQVKKWPVNPLDVIVKKILKLPKSHSIADMGCGEAALSKRVPHAVRSFDLVATSPGVEVCDMARTPLLTESMDAVVYCLALMGTDLTQYLVEANRVLKMGGQLLIAEVESRFDDVDSFTRDVEKLGFKLKQLDKTHKVFFFMQFAKVREPPKKNKLPQLALKPCLYKRR